MSLCFMSLPGQTRMPRFIEFMRVIEWKSHTCQLKAHESKIAHLVNCFYLQTFSVFYWLGCDRLCHKSNWLLLMSPVEVILHQLGNVHLSLLPSPPSPPCPPPPPSPPLSFDGMKGKVLSCFKLVKGRLISGLKL